METDAFFRNLVHQPDVVDGRTARQAGRSGLKWVEVGDILKPDAPFSLVRGSSICIPPIGPSSLPLLGTS